MIKLDEVLRKATGCYNGQREADGQYPCEELPSRQLRALTAALVWAVNRELAEQVADRQIGKCLGPGDVPAVWMSRAELEARPMNCGHRPSCIETSDEGTSYCRRCEELARLQVGEPTKVREVAVGVFQHEPDCGCRWCREAKSEANLK